MPFFDDIIRERNEACEAACSAPQPGDYWHEMFCPQLVVIDVREESVVVCKKVKQLPGDKWTWDLTELEWMPRAEFRKRLTYSSIPGFVGDVFPKGHAWVVDVLGA